MSAARVGPVLRSGEVADAIVEVLSAENEGLEVIDRGAYLRVSAPGRCRLRRAAVEAALGRPFRLPGNLERAMPSFVGRFRVDEDEACWEAAAPAGEAVRA